MVDKILVVDDEDGILRVLKLSLSESGYHVLTASHGKEAMRIMATEHPSIVLADIRMPGMDGIELLQKIKEEDPATEVIMMTGYAELEHAVKSLQFEAVDFITKPINYDALQATLKRVHERIWMRRQLQDYTESLERLVSEKTQKLLEAERLAAMGQTIATLSHSIKNIVGGLKGGLFVLDKGIELNERKYLIQAQEMLHNNLDRIKNLAMNLLNYSKQREPDYDLCDPNIPAREVYHLLLPRARNSSITLKLDLVENLGRVYLDPQGIYDCLLNLATNAMDACGDLDSLHRSGEVVIRSRKVPGWAVEYHVSDNGCGMDKETKTKAFHSFFSTKGSKGSGLGLMITEKIVREHGGTIELESELGRGSHFIIRLPERKDVVKSIYADLSEGDADDLAI